LPLLPLLLGGCTGYRLEALKQRELAEVRVAFDANLAAIQRRDVERYLATYLDSPDFAYVGPGGMQRGFAPFAAARRADPAFPDSLAAGEAELVWLAPGVVYAVYPFAARQGDSAGRGWSERVFVKSGRGWKIAVTSVIPEAGGGDRR
jgi:ketosteroid isomerase-like protein